MRVIRRSALPHIYPLPDGLHFTPAMSARTLLEGRLKLIEIAMPYSERVGQSKLSVLKDGVRFLNAIISAAICYRPARPLLLLAFVTAVIALLMAAIPVIHYLRFAALEEWMVYRLLLASLLATLSALTTCVAIIADRIAETAHGRASPSRRMVKSLRRWSRTKVTMDICWGRARLAPSRSFGPAYGNILRPGTSICIGRAHCSHLC